jgi:hypothetical protein
VTLGARDREEPRKERAVWKRFFASMLEAMPEDDESRPDPVRRVNEVIECLTLPRHFLASTERAWEDEELAHLSECRSCQTTAETVAESLTAGDGDGLGGCPPVTVLIKGSRGDDVGEAVAAHLVECNLCQPIVAASWRSTHDHPSPTILIEHLAGVSALSGAVAQHLESGCYLCSALTDRSESLRRCAAELATWPPQCVPAGAAWDVPLPRPIMLWDTTNEPRFYQRLDPKNDLAATLRATDDGDFVVEVWGPNLDDGTVEVEIVGERRSLRRTIDVRPGGWPPAQQKLENGALDEVAGRCAVLVMRPAHRRSCAE